MADPPPLDGVIRPPEPYAFLQLALPPAQPLVDDGATAAGIVAMPALGLKLQQLTFDAATAATGLNADLAHSQHDAARRSHQAALATADLQLDVVRSPARGIPQKTQTTKLPDPAVVARTPFWSFCAG